MIKLFDSIFDSEPDYVNEKGTKFWIDDNLSDYAKMKKLDCICYYVEDIKGNKSRLLVDVQKSMMIRETPNLEEMACFIDILHLDKIVK